jgi:hypothetical protein
MFGKCTEALRGMSCSTMCYHIDTFLRCSQLAIVATEVRKVCAVDYTESVREVLNVQHFHGPFFLKSDDFHSLAPSFDFRFGRTFNFS